MQVVRVAELGSSETGRLVRYTLSRRIGSTDNRFERARKETRTQPELRCINRFPMAALSVAPWVGLIICWTRPRRDCDVCFVIAVRSSDNDPKFLSQFAGVGGNSSVDLGPPERALPNSL